VSFGNGSKRGVTVKLFLADGTPDGLRIVEKSNWTGMATMCSRAQYLSVRTREEFSRPGVYVLVGPSDGGGSRQKIYIGEADIARERIDNHLKGKDFWTNLIRFSSKDTNLNKAHVQYLEARLVELARQAKRADIENANSPRLPSLSEADMADMSAFLDDMLVIYPLLGVSAFEVVAEVASPTELRLELRVKDTLAFGADRAEGFTVFKDSLGRLETVPSIHAYMRDLRNKLIADGVLILDHGQLRLTQDYQFESPTTAAGVFAGRPANGRTEWKDDQNRKLREIQEAAVRAD